MERYALLTESGHTIATAKGTTPSDIAESFAALAKRFILLATGEAYRIVNSQAVKEAA